MYLYIVYNGRHYKIGITKSPNYRLRTLQTASPTKLSFYRLFKLEVDRKRCKAIESQIHKMLWQHRSRTAKGEWFDLDLEYLNFIEEWINELVHFSYNFYKGPKPNMCKNQYHH